MGLSSVQVFVAYGSEKNSAFSYLSRSKILMAANKLWFCSINYFVNFNNEFKPKCFLIFHYDVCALNAF